MEYAFEKMRDVQIDVIEQINEAFKNGYKYIMLEAPTGIGKSGILVSIALQQGESYINTSSKLLQDQYLQDFPFIRTIKGKSNFDCINPEEKGPLTCEKGYCNFNKKYICSVKPAKTDYIVFNRGTKQESVNYFHQPKEVWDTNEYKQTRGLDKRCLYYEQKMKGFVAGHTIMNYPYFFSMFFYTGDDMHYRKLLVFDEAHNIENQILEFLSISPNPGYYEELAGKLFDEYLTTNVKIPPYPTNDKFENWIDYLKATVIWMSETFNYYDERTKVKRSDLSRLESTLKKLSHVTSIMEQDRENWVIDVKNQGGKIESVKISPIETGPYVKPVFEIADKVILASATLLDKEVYANMIGVPLDQIAFIRLNSSPFPKQNRPVYLMNVGEMNYKTMDNLMPQIVGYIDTILNKHNSERGIIHCTSYKQLDYILENSKNKARLIKTESGKSQTRTLEKAALYSDSVLISPSMHEGVDLKDDLSRFQITIKIPYMDLSDKRTMIKMRKSPLWYQWHATLKLIQGFGRSIRNEKDYAVTYVLDSKAGYVLQNKFTPQYIREAIVKL